MWGRGNYQQPPPQRDNGWPSRQTSHTGQRPSHANVNARTDNASWRSSGSSYNSTTYRNSTHGNGDPSTGWSQSLDGRTASGLNHRHADSQAQGRLVRPSRVTHQDVNDSQDVTGSSSGDIWSSLPTPTSNQSTNQTRNPVGPQLTNTASHSLSPPRSVGNDIWSSIPTEAAPGSSPKSTSVRPNTSHDRPLPPRTSNGSKSIGTPDRPHHRHSILESPSTAIKPISQSHRAHRELDKMEMIGTLSRSGGVGEAEADGKELLDWSFQEQFLEWVLGKLERFWNDFPNFVDAVPQELGLVPRPRDHRHDDATQQAAQHEQTPPDSQGTSSLNTILLQLRNFARPSLPLIAAMPLQSKYTSYQPCSL